MRPTVFDKAGFGKSPEPLYPIDVGLVRGELIIVTPQDLLNAAARIDGYHKTANL